MNEPSPSRVPETVELIAAYADQVTVMQLQSAQRFLRLRAARSFLRRWPDMRSWMGRPTPARLTDLHRLKAWPFLSYCFVEGHLHPDLEILLAKPGGCELPKTWCTRHAEDVSRVAEAGRQLGWSNSWIRQVSVLALSTLCLWAGKSLSDIDDADLDAILKELDQAAHVSASARFHARTRLYALAQACFQLGILARPRRKAGPASKSPAELAAGIRQQEIGREVVRYAQTIGTTLRPGSVYGRVKAIMVLFDWLAEAHPEVRRIDQLERVTHIEPFLAWSRSRPWRGANGRGRQPGGLVAVRPDFSVRHSGEFHGRRHVEGPGGRGARNTQVGRLVEPPPFVGADRSNPAGRGRSAVLQSTPHNRRGCESSK